MQDIKQLTEHLYNLCNELPDFCSSFLLETATERAIKTRLAYAHEIKVFFEYLISYNPHFAEMQLTDIQLSDMKMVQTSDINRYLSLSLNSLSKKTVARKRAALSSFFKYLSNGTDRKLERNPVDGSVNVKIPEKDTVIYLDAEEQNRFLQAVKYGTGLDKKKMKYHERYAKRDAALMLLFLDTGMRISEITGIDIQDVDLERCSVIITRKGGKTQTLYFSDEARDLIDDYLTERRTKYPYIGSEEPLFATLQGDRLSIRAIQALVDKYAAISLGNKASLISPHKLRSSFAMVYYKASGNNLLALQRELGHKSIAATNIYAKATDGTLKQNRSLTSDARKGFL